MPVLKFAGQSSRDTDAEFANTSRMLNCYREPAEDRVVIKSVLGSEALVDLADVFLRAMTAVNGEIFAACGGNLYCIKTGGGYTNLGAVGSGDTTISSNNGVVTVAADGVYSIWDGATLSTPTGAAFSDVGSVTFVGQHTVISEEGGRRFAWSDPADPATFDGLDFASAEGRDDDILRVVGLNGSLVIFKETSREIWYLTGSSDSTLAFQRMAGGVVDTGLWSYNLLAELDQAVFFVGDDGIVYLTEGLSQKAISNRAVETAIAEGEPQRCFFYEDEGHKFACITFRNRPAWCFDLATNDWHERENGYQRWSVVSTVKVGRQWYSGTDLGEVRLMKRNNTDAGDPLIRRAVSKTFYNDAGLFRVAELEFFGRVGSVLDGSSAAECSLRLSKDNGRTWGDIRTKSLGALGEYETRVLWRSLGQFRRLTAELSWATADEISFVDEARVRLA